MAQYWYYANKIIIITKKLIEMYRLRLGTPTLNFLSVFDEFFDETLDVTSRKCPAHNVIENDDEFIIEMELAGVKKEDVSIDTENGALTIEAERKKDEKVKYNRKESYVGKYKRSFILPNDVNIEGIEAELTDGILNIKIPKTIDETKKKKQIVIK